MSTNDCLDWQIERIDPKHTPWYGKKAVLEHKLRYDFTKRFVKNKIVIDLGCGVGYGAFELAKSGARKVYGIDISSNTIEYAKAHYSDESITYEAKDALNTKLPSGIADVVTAFEVIEHVMDHKKFLQEALRLLRPNGIFIMSTPNSDASFGDNPYHIKEFAFQELRKILSIFKTLQFYGQHKVSKAIIKIYKAIARRLVIPSVHQLLRFRPWEPLTIEPIKSPLKHTYLYFVVICKK